VKRLTITLDDQLEAALAAYGKRQEAPPVLTSVVQAALREYLARRGVVAQPKPFQITPAKKGGVKRDVSVHHDEYLARKR
jgi:hypothetical protein